MSCCIVDILDDDVNFLFGSFNGMQHCSDQIPIGAAQNTNPLLAMMDRVLVCSQDKDWILE